MKKLNNISFIVMLVFIACVRTPDPRTTQVLSISSEPLKVIPVEDLFEHFDYIKLETNDSCLLSEVSGIVLNKNILYLSDKGRIIKFDLLGNYLQTIDHRGQGPGEYTGISDFMITGDSLCILNRNKILFYSLSGTFINQHIIEGVISSMHISLLNDSLLVLNNGYFYPGNKFHLVDRNHFTTVKRFIPIDEHKLDYLHIMGDPGFSYSDGKLLYSESMCNTIYEITPDSVFARYQLDFQDKTPPASFWNKHYADILDFYTTFRQSGYMCGASVFAEGPRNLLFSYVFNRDNNYCLYNKKEAKSVHFQSISLAKDLLPVRISPPNLIPLSDGIIAMFIPADEILNHNHQKSDVLVGVVSENDNPVLCLGALR